MKKQEKKRLLLFLMGFVVFLGITIGKEKSIRQRSDREAVNLTSSSLFDDQNPAWFSDGSKMIFTSKRGRNNDFGIWTMDSDGSNPVLLFDGNGDDVNMPGSCFCRANGRLCFSSDTSGNDEIWTVKMDGSDIRQITDNPAPDWEPTWSPDGKWIVFQSFRENNWDIYKIRHNGTGLVRLSDHPAEDWQPNWSPAGGNIVFQSKRTGNWDIWIMDPSGSEFRNITEDTAEDTDPSFSPCGMFVVYSSDRESSNDPDLWITSIVSQFFFSPVHLVYNNAYEGAPSWSPDGKKIAYESDVSGNLDIWILELDMEPRLAAIQDSLYILQTEQISIEKIANNDYDLVVMDYAKFGDAASEYTKEEISEIKNGGTQGRSKVVLAYMSIGEAEDYRFYWDPDWRPGSPSWLGPLNPNWSGNYKVRYWEKQWKDIIYGTDSGVDKSYLDRIIDQGFDGVYLDIIDAYEYWSGEEGGYEKTRFQARTEMVYFLKELRDYARITRGKSNFLVFPQNAANIIYDDNEILDDLGRDYLEVCDGIGQEDTWYNETVPQPKEDYDWVTQLLDVYKNNGKLVLSVDYIWDAGNSGSGENKTRFNDFYTKAYARGYIPYAANKNRDLSDIITVTQGNGFDFNQPKQNTEDGKKKFPIRRD